jgi:transposase-like protein
MGVWPDTDRCEILRWHLGHSEDLEEWVTFLSLLEEQDIRGENGLKLIIHDEASGLCSALPTVHFGAEEQRCLFLKLRSLYTAIQVPDRFSAKQEWRRRKAIFKAFRAIWQARRYDTVPRRYLKVVRTYRHSQPEAVATLRRDLRSTITYYRLKQPLWVWDRKHLRTTSRLECLNRRIRRRARAACAYHSDQGLLAMVAQEAHLFHAAQRDMQFSPNLMRNHGGRGKHQSGFLSRRGVPNRWAMPPVGLMEIGLRWRSGNGILVVVSPPYLDFGHFRTSAGTRRIFNRFQVI